MNKNFKDFARNILKNINTKYDYQSILHLLIKKTNVPINIDNDKNSISSNPSGYYVKKIDSNLYISLRISDHLPYLRNYIKNNIEIPSNKEYSHICLLIFGYTELSNIRPRSAQGNYVMGSEHTTVKLNVNHAIFSYYSNNTEIDIPYHIYHFLPEFITENDLDLLSLSIDKWSSNEGNEPFELSSSLSQNVYYDKHRESKISSIDCTMIIRRSTTNESARMVSGKTPMLSFDMGRVTLVSPSGEEITLQGTLEIKDCSSSDFLMLCEFNKSTKTQNINGNEEDFDFDKEIEKDEKKRKDKNKNYLESLNSIKDTELYEKIMTEIKEVIKKYLG